MKPRLCVVVASEITVRAFLRHQIAAMQRVYDVTVVVNTTNPRFLQQMGLTARLQPIRIERGVSLGADIYALIQLARVLRRGHFDLVHSITPKAGLLAMVGGLIAGTPLRLHTFTGQVWATRRGWRRALLKTIDRRLAASATLTLADSSSQRDFLIEQRIVTPAKSLVLGHGSISGVDPGRFHPDVLARYRIRRELGIPASDLVLLFIGRITRDKGVLDLARAFAHLAAARSDLRLLVVGVDEEELRPELQRMVARHQNRLHFVDFTSEPEAFMAASDLLCLPSYREGFGSVIIEAAAVGLPAVASRIYGVVDAIDEGRTGLCHAPRDVEALIAAVIKIVSDAELRARMGAAARARAVTQFSQSAVTGAVLDLYDRLLREMPVRRYGVHERPAYH